MSQDIVADALNQIMNAKRARKKVVIVKKKSKFLINVLDFIKKLGYIDYEVEDLIVKITINKLNECKAIKPRYNVKVERIDKYVRRYLPARNFGEILISTNKGLMTHHDAVSKNLGGCLVAYIY